MFDYFYGQSGEMFSYFRVPKILFRDIKFKDLSTDAKTLYGILLDRMGLSVKNGWLDEQGRVYIIFPVQEVMDALGCADNKATKLFRELEKFGMTEGTLPHKILLMMEPADCERAERELQALFPALNIVRSAPHLLEIMDASVNKASGIEVMLKHFGLEASDALSFGDNYNDLEMLRYTGASVAMGNAPQPVKEAAGIVTTSNEEDGIYAYLSEHHLIG